MKKALIGFGGLGQNMLDSQSKYDMDFILSGLVRSGDSQYAGLDKKAAFYSPQELGVLAQKLDSAEVCFMVGDLGGDSCQYMTQLGRELRKAGIMTVALVATPFRFEHLTETAEAHLREVEGCLDAMLVFDNSGLTSDQGRVKSLANALQGVYRTMYCCMKAMTAAVHDVVDLRECLHGRIYFGPGESDENVMQALRKAVDAIKKEFPANFKIASGIITFCSGSMPDLSEACEEVRDFLDGDNVSWLVSFENHGPEDGNSVILLAC